MNKYLVISLLIIQSLQISFGQNDLKNWNVKPNSNLGFTENQNRFTEIMGEQIYYFNEFVTYTVFFSDKSIIIGTPKESPSELSQEHKKDVQPIEWEYFKIQFQNINIASTTIGKNLNSYTRNFQNPENSNETIKAKAYENLIYKNIYEKIDLIFEVPSTGGLKYSFIVHPGGDYRNIEMKYINIEPTKIDDGKLELVNDNITFFDQAPISFVAEKEVSSEFICENNRVHFKLDEYDTTKELIIDPWLIVDVTVEFGVSVYEIAYDNQENCAIVLLPTLWYEEVYYYDSNGVLQWTWVTPLGASADIDIDPISQNIYVTKWAGSISLLNSFGSLINFYDISAVSGEAIRLQYNRFMDQVNVSLGGYIGDESDVIIFDPSLFYVNDEEIFVDPSSTMEDCALFETDPEDGSLYFVPSIIATWHPETIYTHKLFKVDATDPTLILWESYSSHDFTESGSNVDYKFGGDIGANGIACGYDFVYTYDGNQILKYNKDSGTLEGSIALGLSPFFQYGMDTDDCGNLYVGTDDSVLVFDSNLEQINGYPVPGPCHDLVVGLEKLYVCGDNFVTKIDLDFSLLLSTSTPAYCGNTNGTATVELDVCEGFTVDNVLWSPGGKAGETITNLSAGWYYSTVTLVNREGDQLIKLDSVEVLSENEELVINTEVINDFCLTSCSGNAVFTTISGHSPYTYSLGMETNGTGVFSNVCVGDYPILITDSNGCSYADTLKFDDCSDSTSQTIMFVAPNIFTPNSDLVNDQFTFEFNIIGIENFSCVILNRWGKIVSTLDGINDYWDGTNQKGRKCSAGVYFYSYEATNANGESFKGHGNVQLVR